MENFQIQLLDYSFNVLSELFDSRLDKNKKFTLVFKSENDIFTASTLKYSQFNVLEFYTLSNDVSTYREKLSLGQYSIFQKVRNAVFEANSDFNGLLSLANYPELLLKKLNEIVTEVIKNTDDVSNYPFVLYNYKSLINDYKLDFVDDNNLSLQPISLIVHESN